MSVVELHPEILLDRLDRLTDDEHRLLMDHLKTCEACALQVDGPRLFDTELKARPGDEDLDEIAIRRALLEYSGRGTARLRTRLRKTPLVVALTIATGAAAAAAGTWEVVRRVMPMEPVTVTAPTVERMSENEPSVSPRPQPATEPEPDTDVTTPERDTADVGQPTVIHKAPAPPTPAELFADANAARRSGQDGQAIQLYSQLQRSYPASREARISYATLGRLFLERGKDGQAVEQFDRLLANTASGPLAEDALVARAVALGRLGRRSEERANWERLLERFPSSVHAARAKERLSALR